MSDSIPVGVEREALIRALLLAERLSIGVTRLVGEVLGGRTTGNRDVGVLLAVAAGAPLTPSDIVEITGMRPSAVSRALANLVEGHLVVRVDSAADARSVLLHLTRRGTLRVRRLDELLWSWIEGEAPTIKELVALLPVVPSMGAPAGSGLAVTQQLIEPGQAYVDDVTEALAPYGVTDRSERYALTLLADRSMLRPSDLAFELGLSTSGASTLLSRMEDASLIERHHDERSDRRVVNVVLTSRGRSAVDIKVTVFGEHAGRFLAPLAATLDPHDRPPVTPKDSR